MPISLREKRQGGVTKNQWSSKLMKKRRARKDDRDYKARAGLGKRGRKCRRKPVEENKKR